MVRAARIPVAAAVAFATAFFGPQTLAAQSTAFVAGELDRAARTHVASDMIPGVSVAVVRGDEVLLHRGFGYVDLEWDVRTPLDASASYEIGSVTKQFTAAALMLLVEEGKVDLDADFRRYVEFDTGGRPITVRRLLDHTSGIRSYTEMSMFGEIAVMDLPRDTLLRLVETEAFDFEPGSAQIYNNSAYFLLGLVIEAVSGMSYEDFVVERLFAPAGMEDSYYCSETAVVERRANGYDATGPGRLIRARYLDHTWPYAAGSLCSTAGDLVAWNRALHGGRILSEPSYAAMTTPVPLVDGTPIRYAMGLSVDTVGGHFRIAHGGGINGFVSSLAYYPDHELSVVVLQNSTAPPGAGGLANRLAEIVLGSEPEPEAPTFSGDASVLSGTYRGAARGSPMEVTVALDGEALTVQPSGAPEPIRPIYRGGMRWDVGNVRYVFVRQGSGVVELRVDVGSGHYVLRPVGG